MTTGLSSSSILNTEPLVLRATGVGIDMIDFLPEKMGDSLCLFASKNNISRIEKITQFPRLSRVMLENNKIRCVEHFRPLRRLTQLVELRVGGNPALDLPFCIFNILYYCPTIKFLNGKPVQDYYYNSNGQKYICELVEKEHSLLDFIAHCKAAVKIAEMNNSPAPYIFNHYFKQIYPYDKLVELYHSIRSNSPSLKISDYFVYLLKEAKAELNALFSISHREEFDKSLIDMLKDIENSLPDDDMNFSVASINDMKELSKKLVIDKNASESSPPRETCSSLSKSFSSGDSNSFSPYSSHTPSNVRSSILKGTSGNTPPAKHHSFESDSFSSIISTHINSSDGDLFNKEYFSDQDSNNSRSFSGKEEYTKTLRNNQGNKRSFVRKILKNKFKHEKHNAHRRDAYSIRMNELPDTDSSYCDVQSEKLDRHEPEVNYEVNKTSTNEHHKKKLSEMSIDEIIQGDDSIFARKSSRLKATGTHDSQNTNETCLKTNSRVVSDISDKKQGCISNGSNSDLVILTQKKSSQADDSDYDVDNKEGMRQSCLVNDSKLTSDHKHNNSGILKYNSGGPINTKSSIIIEERAEDDANNRICDTNKHVSVIHLPKSVDNTYNLDDRASEEDSDSGVFHFDVPDEDDDSSQQYSSDTRSTNNLVSDSSCEREVEYLLDIKSKRPLKKLKKEPNISVIVPDQSSFTRSELDAIETYKDIFGSEFQDSSNTSSSLPETNNCNALNKVSNNNGSNKFSEESNVAKNKSISKYKTKPTKNLDNKVDQKAKNAESGAYSGFFGGIKHANISHSSPSKKVTLSPKKSGSTNTKRNDNIVNKNLKDSKYFHVAKKNISNISTQKRDGYKYLGSPTKKNTSNKKQFKSTTNYGLKLGSQSLNNDEMQNMSASGVKQLASDNNAILQAKIHHESPIDDTGKTYSRMKHIKNEEGNSPGNKDKGNRSFSNVGIRNTKQTPVKSNESTSKYYPAYSDSILGTCGTKGQRNSQKSSKGAKQRDIRDIDDDGVKFKGESNEVNNIPRKLHQKVVSSGECMSESNVPSSNLMKDVNDSSDLSFAIRNSLGLDYAYSSRGIIHNKSDKGKQSHNKDRKSDVEGDEDTEYEKDEVLYITSSSSSFHKYDFDSIEGNKLHNESSELDSEEVDIIESDKKQVLSTSTLSSSFHKSENEYNKDERSHFKDDKLGTKYNCSMEGDKEGILSHKTSSAFYESEDESGSHSRSFSNYNETNNKGNHYIKSDKQQMMSMPSSMVVHNNDSDISNTDQHRSPNKSSNNIFKYVFDVKRIRNIGEPDLKQETRESSIIKHTNAGDKAKLNKPSSDLHEEYSQQQGEERNLELFYENNHSTSNEKVGELEVKSKNVEKHVKIQGFQQNADTLLSKNDKSHVTGGMYRSNVSETDLDFHEGKKPSDYEITFRVSDNDSVRDGNASGFRAKNDNYSSEFIDESGIKSILKRDVASVEASSDIYLDDNNIKYNKIRALDACDNIIGTRQVENDQNRLFDGEYIESRNGDGYNSNRYSIYNKIIGLDDSQEERNDLHIFPLRAHSLQPHDIGIRSGCDRFFDTEIHTCRKKKRSNSLTNYIRKKIIDLPRYDYEGSFSNVAEYVDNGKNHMMDELFHVTKFDNKSYLKDKSDIVYSYLIDPDGKVLNSPKRSDYICQQIKHSNLDMLATETSSSTLPKSTDNISLTADSSNRFNEMMRRSSGRCKLDSKSNKDLLEISYDGKVTGIPSDSRISRHHASYGLSDDNFIDIAKSKFEDSETSDPTEIYYPAESDSHASSGMRTNYKYHKQDNISSSNAPNFSFIGSEQEHSGMYDEEVINTEQPNFAFIDDNGIIGGSNNDNDYKTVNGFTGNNNRAGTSNFPVSRDDDHGEKSDYNFAESDGFIDGETNLSFDSDHFYAMKGVTRRSKANTNWYSSPPAFEYVINKENFDDFAKVKSNIQTSKLSSDTTYSLLEEEDYEDDDQGFIMFESPGIVNDGTHDTRLNVANVRAGNTIPPHYNTANCDNTSTANLSVKLPSMKTLINQKGKGKITLRNNNSSNDVSSQNEQEHSKSKTPILQSEKEYYQDLTSPRKSLVYNEANSIKEERTTKYDDNDSSEGGRDHLRSLKSSDINNQKVTSDKDSMNVKGSRNMAKNIIKREHVPFYDDFNSNLYNSGFSCYHYNKSDILDYSEHPNYIVDNFDEDYKTYNQNRNNFIKHSGWEFGSNQGLGLSRVSSLIENHSTYSRNNIYEMHQAQLSGEKSIMSGSPVKQNTYHSGFTPNKSVVSEFRYSELEKKKSSTSFPSYSPLSKYDIGRNLNGSLDYYDRNTFSPVRNSVNVSSPGTKIIGKDNSSFCSYGSDIEHTSYIDQSRFDVDTKRGFKDLSKSMGNEINRFNDELKPEFMNNTSPVSKIVSQRLNEELGNSQYPDGFYSRCVLTPKPKGKRVTLSHDDLIRSDLSSDDSLNSDLSYDIQDDQDDILKEQNAHVDHVGTINSKTQLTTFLHDQSHIFHNTQVTPGSVSEHDSLPDAHRTQTSISGSGSLSSTSISQNIFSDSGSWFSNQMNLVSNKSSEINLGALEFADSRKASDIVSVEKTTSGAYSSPSKAFRARSSLVSGNYSNNLSKAQKTSMLHGSSYNMSKTQATSLFDSQDSNVYAYESHNMSSYDELPDDQLNFSTNVICTKRTRYSQGETLAKKTPKSPGSFLYQGSRTIPRSNISSFKSNRSAYESFKEINKRRAERELRRDFDRVRNLSYEDLSLSKGSFNLEDSGIALYLRYSMLRAFIKWRRLTQKKRSKKSYSIKKDAPKKARQSKSMIQEDGSYIFKIKLEQFDMRCKEAQRNREKVTKEGCLEFLKPRKHKSVILSSDEDMSAIFSD